MPRDVKLFLRKTALFSLPFLFYGAVIGLIDPYCYFGTGGPIPQALKRQAAYPLNYAMWKMIEYRRNPVQDILLGDSRMMNLDSARVDSVSGRHWYNFAYGGGTLREAIDTFDYARSRTDLRSVVIGLDLSTWNGSDLRDRVSETRGALRNPLLYLLNTNVMRATGRIVTAMVDKEEVRIGKPDADQDEFWRHQLDVTARVYFEGWSDPAGYRRDLQRVAEICRTEDIELVFVIFPTHTDLQGQIEAFGLTEADRRMRDELAALGVVYDFSWANEFTRDRSNFVDPYHQTYEAAGLVIRTIWGGERHNVRILGRTE